MFLVNKLVIANIPSTHQVSKCNSASEDLAVINGTNFKSFKLYIGLS